jgi:predicted small metal-binding protein
MFSHLIAVHKKTYDKKKPTSEFKDTDKMNEDTINKLKSMIAKLS